MEDHHLQPNAADENTVQTLAAGVADLLGGAEADYRQVLRLTLPGAHPEHLAFPLPLPEEQAEYLAFPPPLPEEQAEHLAFPPPLPEEQAEYLAFPPPLPEEQAEHFGVPMPQPGHHGALPQPGHNGVAHPPPHVVAGPPAPSNFGADHGVQPAAFAFGADHGVPPAAFAFGADHGVPPAAFAFGADHGVPLGAFAFGADHGVPLAASALGADHGVPPAAFAFGADHRVPSTFGAYHSGPGSASTLGAYQVDPHLVSKFGAYPGDPGPASAFAASRDDPRLLMPTHHGPEEFRPKLISGEGVDGVLMSRWWNHQIVMLLESGDAQVKTAVVRHATANMTRMMSDAAGSKVFAAALRNLTANQLNAIVDAAVRTNFQGHSGNWINSLKVLLSTAAEEGGQFPKLLDSFLKTQNLVMSREQEEGIVEHLFSATSNQYLVRYGVEHLRGSTECSRHMMAFLTECHKRAVGQELEDLEELIVTNGTALGTQQYGKYVVERVLRHGGSETCRRLVDGLLTQVVKLCQNGDGRHLVLRCCLNHNKRLPLVWDAIMGLNDDELCEMVNMHCSRVVLLHMLKQGPAMIVGKLASRIDQLPKDAIIEDGLHVVRFAKRVCIDSKFNFNGH